MKLDAIDELLKNYYESKMKCLARITIEEHLPDYVIHPQSLDRMHEMFDAVGIDVKAERSAISDDDEFADYVFTELEDCLITIVRGNRIYDYDDVYYVDRL